jgi:hypothetical protein
VKLHNNLIDISDSGDVTATGYVQGVKTGVFAYLTAPAVTTVTTSGTYYPIAGTFANSPIENFTTVADPAIKYIGTLTQYMEVDWHAAVGSTSNGVTVTVGIKKTGNLETSSLMAFYCKTGGEVYQMSGTTVISMATNDTVQLVLTANADTEGITVSHFTTTIREFFD